MNTNSKKMVKVQSARTIGNFLRKNNSVKRQVYNLSFTNKEIDELIEALFKCEYDDINVGKWYVYLTSLTPWNKRSKKNVLRFSYLTDNGWTEIFSTSTNECDGDIYIGWDEYLVDFKVIEDKISTTQEIKEEQNMEKNNKLEELMKKYEALLVARTQDYIARQLQSYEDIDFVSFENTDVLFNDPEFFSDMLIYPEDNFLMVEINGYTSTLDGYYTVETERNNSNDRLEQCATFDLKMLYESNK